MRTFRDLRCAKFGCSVPDRVQKFTVKETNKHTETQILCIHGHSVGGCAKALRTVIIIVNLLVIVVVVVKLVLVVVLNPSFKNQSMK